MLPAELQEPAAAPDVCDLPGTVLNPFCVGRDVVGGTVGGVADTALRQLGEAVVGAAQELFAAVLEFITAPVRPQLESTWFVSNVDRMVTVSAVFATLFFVLGLTQAILRSSLADLGRLVGMTVLAFASTGVALAATQSFIVLVDVATAQIAAGMPEDMAQTFSALLNPLVTLAAGPGGQVFLAIVLGIATLLGMAVVYLELFVRNVMIHVVLYFLPLMLVGLIWGPTRRWARRSIEFLAVLIASKFVIYAVIALGWSAITAFDDQALTTSWASVLTGLVLIAVAAWMPWLLFKLLPFMELHVASALQRRQAGAAVTAPMAPVSAGMRTVEQNLRRAAVVAAAVKAGPALAASGGGKAAGGGRGAGGGFGQQPTNGTALTPGPRPTGSVASPGEGNNHGGSTPQTTRPALPATTGRSEDRAPEPAPALPAPPSRPAGGWVPVPPRDTPRPAPPRPVPPTLDEGGSR